MSADTSRSPRSVVSGVQGLYYLATGVWPLVHIESFMDVTGSKTDLWLVYTVGVLIAVVGSVLLLAARTGRVTPEVSLLAVGSAVGLAAIDIIFVTRGVIAPIYLAKTAPEPVLVVSWLVAGSLRASSPEWQGGLPSASPSRAG
jgi:hypothetical protein